MREKLKNILRLSARGTRDFRKSTPTFRTNKITIDHLSFYKKKRDKENRRIRGSKSDAESPSFPSREERILLDYDRGTLQGGISKALRNTRDSNISHANLVEYVSNRIYIPLPRNTSRLRSGTKLERVSYWKKETQKLLENHIFRFS